MHVSLLKTNGCVFLMYISYIINSVNILYWRHILVILYQSVSNKSSIEPALMCVCVCLYIYIYIYIIYISTWTFSVSLDLCHSKDLPEVDLVSLVEEQIPRYRLRADTITSFSGYKHDDFIKTPVLRPDVELDLSLELIEETLKYFSKYEKITFVFYNNHNTDIHNTALRVTGSDIEGVLSNLLQIIFMLKMFLGNFLLVERIQNDRDRVLQALIMITSHSEGLFSTLILLSLVS